MRFVVENGPAAVQWLIDKGVDFTREEGEQSIPPHSRKAATVIAASLHTADATGREITGTLLIKQVLAAKNIDIFEHHCAVDLVTQADRGSRKIRCTGAYILDMKSGVCVCSGQKRGSGTGGASKAYLYTSNPDGASGDGIAMAWRAAAAWPIWNSINSTPPASITQRPNHFLITEALRGEGRCCVARRQRFMHNFHPCAELAPGMWWRGPLTMR